jgi:DNA-directed RNA polymerase specialized sigma24 family protein
MEVHAPDAGGGFATAPALLAWSRQALIAMAHDRQAREGNEPGPWAVLCPLPPLDAILPAHTAYVRSVVARFSVHPAYWRPDLVQEVLIQAHRSRDSRLDVRALLFGITRHVVFKWMAKCRAERITLALRPASEPASDRTIEDSFQDAERRAAVWAALAQIPETFREVLLRVEIEHMAMPDVARDLGIPLNTGYTRLRLAQARFLESLQRYLARRHIQGSELL